MLSGSFVALVTPMRSSGEIDWKALDSLIDWHLESGTHGFVPVGTTGEAPTLSVEEKAKVIEATVKRVDGRAPVVAGTGTNSTEDAIELTRAGEALGADACLIVTPYYNRPTQDGLVRHFHAIAEAVPVPIVLYNVPPRTACDMHAATVARLSEVDTIIGIKEACGDASRVESILELAKEEFFVVSGEDAQTLEMLGRGAVGTISVTANVVPRIMSEFCSAWAEGEVDRALELDAFLQPLHRALFAQTSPIPTKWALSRMGKMEGGIRLPLTPLEDEKHQTVLEAMRGVEAL